MVSVKAVETASERQVTTNSEGLYVLPNLQPGLYEVTIAAAGLATTTVRQAVTVGSRNVLDINLAVAPATTPADKGKQVLLIGPELAVEQSTQTLSMVLTEKQIRELPTLTRNIYDLVALSGNVAPSGFDRSGPGATTQRGVGLAINGQRAASVNFLQDGAVNN